MKKIGIFYATATKTTLGIVDEIEFLLRDDEYQTFNVKDGVEQIKDFENLILVSPTYQVGELHPHWMKKLDELEKMDFSGKVVGLVGLGNQFAFGESFCGGLKFLYNIVKEKGGKIVGLTDMDGYHFEETDIIVNGKFMGLPLDETNQANLTPERLSKFITEIKKDFK